MESIPLPQVADIGVHPMPLGALSQDVEEDTHAINHEDDLEDLSKDIVGNLDDMESTIV
jgi:hypothetical protein